MTDSITRRLLQLDSLDFMEIEMEIDKRLENKQATSKRKELVQQVRHAIDTKNAEALIAVLDNRYQKKS